MQQTDAERDEARLRALEAELAKVKAAPEEEPGALGRSMGQANLAWRMVIEMVAGLVIGFGIGWGLDWAFGTKPIFLVLFVLAGLAAGVKVMMRTAAELHAPPPPQAGPQGPDDDD